MAYQSVELFWCVPEGFEASVLLEVLSLICLEHMLTLYPSSLRQPGVYPLRGIRIGT